MVVVDSTVWIDYFRGIANPETEWLTCSFRISVLHFWT